MKLQTEKQETVFDTSDVWTLWVDGIDILATLNWHKGYDDGRQVWEALTPLFGTHWLRLRIMIRRGENKGICWAWPVAGDTSIEQPRLPRREIRITSTPGLSPLVDFTIETEDPLRPDPANAGFTIGGILNGQGVTLRSFWVDFGAGEWAGDDGRFEPNHLMPRSPQKTGGNWDYMAVRYPVETFKLTDVYAIGGYGGFFQHANSGAWVTEPDFPDLQAREHIHERSKDPGWIQYTNPSTPWRDKMSVFRQNPDGQHMCQVSILGQMLDEHPEDEGLKMLAEAWSHVYTRQFPKEPRGTSHANSGQERSQGRVLRSGVDASVAAHGDDEATALRFGLRAMDRFANDKAHYIDNHAKNGIGFHPFTQVETSGVVVNGYSTGEIGIHYWGMWRLHQAMEKLGLDHLEDVHFWMTEAERWCFNSFRFYDIAGDRRWAYPYFEDKNHIDLHGPVSSIHFGWLAATNYKPQNPTEEAKMLHILELGEGLDERFKG